jgi:hypothetical protein
MAKPFSLLPSGAVAAVHRAIEAGQFTQQAGSSAPQPAAADLVARALAILAEETEAWQARRITKPSPGSGR